jgi:glycogen debranching enzyme
VDDVQLVRLHPRPTALYVSRGRTVLATNLDGQVRPERDIGLFVRETRLLSRYEYRIDEHSVEPSALSNVQQHTWLGYYFTRTPGAPLRDPDRGSGMVPLATEETIELRVLRRVGEGFHEDLHLTNFSRSATQFALAVVIEADFADYVESGGDRQQEGNVAVHWDTERRTLTFSYAASSTGRGGTAPARFLSSVSICVSQSLTAARWDGVALRFDVALPPQGSADIGLTFVPAFDGIALETPVGCDEHGRHVSFDARTSEFDGVATRIADDAQPPYRARVFAALRQARADLAALRLFDLDHDERDWVPAAGLPVYVALFGRDTLTTAWQSALLGPEMMRGTLLELAQWIGRDDDPWRDEQPGKLLHEAHTGPTAMLGLNPRQRYYGSITTSGFYPVVLAELWRWTGDRQTVEALLPAALGGLEWLDRESDRNADGFYEYRTRSRDGVKHQAWKDSRDAIVDADGDEVEPPIATCEEQAFVYVAKLHLAEVCWWLDRKDIARRLWREAHDLKHRFNDRFWMQPEGFYAMGLGADGRLIRSVSSNPGHCLAAGIVDSERAAVTADRLMAPDLFSGWGIRTLSALNPAYNPYSYHRGSVWPVEQGSFAIGFLRYGLHDHLWRLGHAVFDAAALFEHERLPELFAGHGRTADQPFPALYPQGNSPQAWSASALFVIVQALLGLYPYAPLRALLLDPHLPEWLPSLTLRGLRVGEASVDLEFIRSERGRTEYRVLDTRGTLHVVRQPSPWSLTAGVGERIRDVIESLLPGH